VSVKLKKHKNCENCGDNLIHIINIFEHYIFHPKHFLKKNLLKSIREEKNRAISESRGNLQPLASFGLLEKEKTDGK